MNFRELAEKRYSCRAYRPDPVDEEVLGRILEAARLAPTAANRQPIRIIVVGTGGREKDLRRIYPKDWFTAAPLVLAVCGVPDEAWVRRQDAWNSFEVDAAIVMEHIVLAAADEGLGTCWIAAFDPAAAREVLGLPRTVVPVAFTPLGRPADSPAVKGRRPLSELVHHDKW